MKNQTKLKLGKNVHGNGTLINGTRYINGGAGGRCLGGREAGDVVVD